MKIVKTIDAIYKSADDGLKKSITQSLSNDRNLIRLFENPPEELLMIVASHVPDLLELFPNIKNEEILEKNIRSYPFSIKFVKNPSKELIDVAVSRDSAALWHLTDEQRANYNRNTRINPAYLPNMDVSGYMINQYMTPMLYSMIEDPTDEANMALLQLGAANIKYIKNQDEKIQLIAIEKIRNAYGVERPGYKDFINPTEEVVIKLLESQPDEIMKVKNPTEKMVMASISSRTRYSSNNYLSLIKKPSRELVEYAIKEAPAWIVAVKNPDDELKALAMSGNPWVAFDNATSHLFTDADRLKAAASGDITFSPYSTDEKYLIESVTHHPYKIEKYQSHRLPKSVYLAAIDTNPKVLSRIQIQFQNAAMRQLAVQGDPNMIGYCGAGVNSKLVRMAIDHPDSHTIQRSSVQRAYQYANDELKVYLKLQFGSYL